MSSSHEDQVQEDKSIVKLYFVQVKETAKDFYFQNWLHSGIGYIWMEDEDHIHFKFIRTSENMPYVSSPSRYIKEDITYTPLSKVITMF